MKQINTAYLVACSNGLEKNQERIMVQLEETIKSVQVSLGKSNFLYRQDKKVQAASAKKRAKILMEVFDEGDYDAVFDVSGGDIALEILSYLDYSAIRNSATVFWGYSDLTTVINAIYAKTSKKSVLFQIRNLAGKNGEEQKKRFLDFQSGGGELFDISVRMLSGQEMEGILVGGNIRCLLKLAGTEYFPKMEGKILFLESWHGKVPQIRSMLWQLRLMGVFEKLQGVLLGTFTEMEDLEDMITLGELFLEIIGRSLPIAKTNDVGHAPDSRALIIGERVKISANGLERYDQEGKCEKRIKDAR